MSDRRLILSSAGLRATATGVVGVLLGVHLAKLGLDAAQIGAVVGAGLAGAAIAGAGLKILYDGLLFVAFQRVKPMDEKEPSHA